MIDELREPLAFQQACAKAREAGKRVALVPTMGALHDGHLALVAAAREHADFVTVSIFVNPTQFGPNEDLDRYPHSHDADRSRCAAAGVDLIFAPDTASMYAEGEETRVVAGETAAALCGAARRGHFDGVVTIVSKLLVLAGPCVAVFGRKDYQQWRVIQRLVSDLFLPVELVGVPIQRAADGLALSSRNRFLSGEQRERALSLSRGLSLAVRLFDAGERRVGSLRQAATDFVAKSVDGIDYVTLCHADTVQPLADDEDTGSRVLLAVAARVGDTRLIDNVVLGEDPPPACQPGQ
jgi:pantoate--beta-alanine ligase